MCQEGVKAHAHKGARIFVNFLFSRLVRKAGEALARKAALDFRTLVLVCAVWHALVEPQNIRKAGEALVRKAALDFRAFNGVHLRVSLCYMACFT